MHSHVRTTSENTDFIILVQGLDKELSIRNGDKDAFYAQFNKIDLIKNVVILYADQTPVGCGAFKEFTSKQVEIKRMYVLPPFRNQGIASAVLVQLETWAYELGYESCVLETGTMLPEAIQLYEKLGYRRIPNYGQYQGIAESVCFEKSLNRSH